jgi:hypothetical protein
LAGSQTSSWSDQAISSVSADRAARQKFSASPARGPSSTVTGKPAVAAKRSTISRDPSVEPSSETISRSGGRVCAAMLASWSGSQRSPL